MNNNKNTDNSPVNLDLDDAQWDWGRFSLHVNQRANGVAVILSNSHGLQKRLASYAYEECPSVEEMSRSLCARILDPSTKSLSRALRKWAGFLEVDLPQRLIEKQRNRLVSMQQMSELLDNLLHTVTVFQDDPAIHDLVYIDSYQRMVKRKFGFVHDKIDKVETPEFLEVEEIKDICMHIQRTLVDRQRVDPKGVLSENRDLAIFLWKFWGGIRPIISSQSMWHVLERDAKEHDSVDE